MKNRIISHILVILFLFSLVSQVRAEEQAAEPGSIEEQIQDYADSICRSDAVSTAATALATHGMFGGGKKLVLDENSAIGPDEECSRSQIVTFLYRAYT